MKRILILGAGRSSQHLIQYLLDKSMAEKWTVTIVDNQPGAAEGKVRNHPNARLLSADIANQNEREIIIRESDIVISLLPVIFHLPVAETCLNLGKILVTASYVTPEIKKLEPKVREKGLLFLFECGLDPGLDHMSAMSIINRLKKKGNPILSFETFTGGLLADTDSSNPWNYKFTWNPRNVVLAGAGGAKYLENKVIRYVPYTKLFQRIKEIDIKGIGQFEGYANRDSIKYLDLYGLSGIPCLYRGTLRRMGFCKAWDIFVQLGITDDSYLVENLAGMTHREFIESFLPAFPDVDTKNKLSGYLNIGKNSPEMSKISWLGLFDDEPIGLKFGTPAQVLEHVLKKKWSLSQDEKDFIIMWHRFEFIDNEQPYELEACLFLTGEDSVRTAMSKSVGLPLAIAVELILKGQIEVRGIKIPVDRRIYEPILDEVVKHGISWIEYDPVPIRRQGKNP